MLTIRSNALLAITLLVANPACSWDDDTAPTAPKPPVDELSPGMLEALERDLGLTADEARARMAAEARGAVIEDQLSVELGSDFGGAWMTADGQTLQVAITDPARADVVRDAGARPVVVNRSLAELESVLDTLDTRADRIPAGVHAWNLDPASNAVIVHAADPDADDVAEWIADLGPAVRVVPSREQPRPLYDVRGGDEIILGGNILCSMGFAVHGGYVTAGHCGGAGTPTAGSNWVASGHVVASSFPGNDHAWVQTNGEWNTLPEINGYGSGGVAVRGSRRASVGSSICRAGRTTGWRCGVIEAHDVTIHYSAGPVYGATRTSACAEGGDSGGSFVAGDQAQGVTSGGSGNCASGGATFYQPVNPILQTYGLSLKTQGGGGAAIASRMNDACIDVPSSHFADGVKLQMWSCNGTNAQRWTRVGDTFRAGGLCMDVAWGATHDGAEIQLAHCSGHSAQRFTLNAHGDLVSLHANKCVDIAGWDRNRGARLIIWPCHGGANQTWYRR